jgi:hypothetical protein
MMVNEDPGERRERVDTAKGRLVGRCRTRLKAECLEARDPTLQALELGLELGEGEVAYRVGNGGPTDSGRGVSKGQRRQELLGSHCEPGGDGRDSRSHPRGAEGSSNRHSQEEAQQQPLHET